MKVGVIAAVVSCLMLSGMSHAHAAGPGTTMVSNVLEDTIVEDATAPVTLIVYSSPTCSYCVEFDQNDLPKLKNSFVREGKLKIIHRPFVRNSIDAMIFMVAEARGKEKFDETVSVFMSKFEELITAEDRKKAVAEIAQSIGMTRADLDAAVDNPTYLAKLTAATEEAKEKFGVPGTPWFFVNGKEVKVTKSFDEIGHAVQVAGAE
jgi:protein-disulfide isomerase